jgi:ribosome maturation factor RimP
VTTYEPIDGRKEFEGTLVAYDESRAVVRDGRGTAEIPVTKIAGARLAIKW